LSLRLLLPRPLGDLAERERSLHLIEGGLHEALQLCASRVIAHAREREGGMPVMLSG